MNRSSTSHQTTPISQKMEQAHLQLKDFKSVSEAQSDESDLTHTQKLEVRRHVEEMEEALRDLED